MKLAIAGDAAGQPLVRLLFDDLSHRQGIDVTDLSTPPEGNDHEFYADLADRVARRLIAGCYDRAILICGTGIGVCISANKVPGIRAALCHDVYSAERAALSNNAQIITMGARVIGSEAARTVMGAFLAHSFDPKGRSAANVTAIDRIDAAYRAR